MFTDIPTPSALVKHTYISHDIVWEDGARWTSMDDVRVAEEVIANAAARDIPRRGEVVPRFHATVIRPTHHCIVNGDAPVWSEFVPEIVVPGAVPSDRTFD